MSEHKIHILTGAIGTGKTSHLIQWIGKRSDVHGILTPVADGKRVFMDAQTKELFEMQAQLNEKNILHVGKYIFSKNSFEKATGIIRNGLMKKEGWLIIDEIGLLELKGEGFCDVLKEIITDKKNPIKVLLVIRDTLLQKVIEVFLQTNSYQIINTSSLVLINETE